MVIRVGSSHSRDLAGLGAVIMNLPSCLLITAAVIIGQWVAGRELWAESPHGEGSRPLRTVIFKQCPFTRSDLVGSNCFVFRLRVTKGLK